MERSEALEAYEPSPGTLREVPSEISTTSEFFASITAPLQPPIVGFVPESRPPPSNQLEPCTPDSHRRSNRLATKDNSGKNRLHVAQEVLAKWLGALQSSQTSESDPLASYMQLFEQPLTKEACDVIKVLMEKGKQPLKKKGGAKIMPVMPAGEVGSTV